jgi:hypothetical protein
MHLAQQLRKDSNGEQLIGLIDGVAAIVLTLLVIEMPILIIQAVEHAGGISQIYLSIGLDVMGYFLISLVVYDIWSIQKSLFQAARSSISQNWPAYLPYGYQHLSRQCFTSQSTFIGVSTKISATTDFSANAESLAFRTIAISIIFIIHLILFDYTTKKCVVIDSKYIRIYVKAITAESDCTRNHHSIFINPRTAIPTKLCISSFPFICTLFICPGQSKLSRAT